MAVPMKNDLTDDEIAFLQGSAAMKTRKRKIHAERERTKDRKPKLPAVTMSVVLVLGILASIIVYVTISSLEPYTGIASSITTLAQETGNGDTSGQAEFIASLSQWKGTGLAITISTTIIIELVLYLQWVFRMNAWDERRAQRKAQARRRKKRQS